MTDLWKLPDFDAIRYSKSFIIDGPLPLEIDYDDVYTPGVRVLAEAVADTLNAHFSTPLMVVCSRNRQGDEDAECEPECSNWSTREMFKHCPWCGGDTEALVAFAS